MRGVAGGEARRFGADFERSSLLAPKSCSGSWEKQAPPQTAAATGAGDRPGPRGPAAAAVPAARRSLRPLAVKVADWCRKWPAGGGLRCERVFGRAGSHTAAPGGSGAERRRRRSGIGAERKEGEAG